MSPVQMYDKLGDYTVLERLGQGGMGVVYHAHHDEYGDVAIKLMPEATKDARSRLLREAGVAASLDHPQIIKVFGIGEHRQRPYIVMELLDGITLKAMIRSGQEIGLERRVALIKQVIQALTYAHEAGVAHRDIKPQNIFLMHDGTVRVLDFGLALSDDSTANGTGRPAGTPAYMAPEQARGEEVDPRADIFAVGAVFYEALTGERAFGRGSVNEVLERVATHEPDPVHHLDERLPETLSAIVQTAMAKDRDERYQSMRELLRAVEQFEVTLAARCDEIRAQISALMALLGPIPPGDLGPPDLQIPLELPEEYFELLVLRERMEGQREVYEQIAGELAWIEEKLSEPLAELDDETLRDTVNRADSFGETWPGHPRAGELGQQVLQELRGRLPLREPVDWGNAGRRPRKDVP